MVIFSTVHSHLSQSKSVVHGDQLIVNNQMKPALGPQGRIQGGVDRVDIHPPFFSKKKFEMSLYLK